MNTDPQPVLTAYAINDRAPNIMAGRASRDWISERFANRCLPMLIANQNGWLLLNEATFTAFWTGTHHVDSLAISYESTDSSRPAKSHFGHGIITWTIPYLFRTSDGYNLHVRGPVNQPKDAVQALEGVVETDWAAATFTMNWKITRPFIDVRFEAREPFCMITPQRRNELECFRPEIRDLGDDAELADRYDRWNTSRDSFIHDMVSGTAHELSWQRDYFRGQDVSGDAGHTDHQTRLHLREFQRDGHVPPWSAERASASTRRERAARSPQNGT